MSCWRSSTTSPVAASTPTRLPRDGVGVRRSHGDADADERDHAEDLDHATGGLRAEPFEHRAHGEPRDEPAEVRAPVDLPDADRQERVQYQQRRRPPEL